MSAVKQHVPHHEPDRSGETVELGDPLVRSPEHPARAPKVTILDGHPSRAGRQKSELIKDGYEQMKITMAADPEMLIGLIENEGYQPDAVYVPGDGGRETENAVARVREHYFGPIIPI